VIGARVPFLVAVAVGVIAAPVSVKTIPFSGAGVWRRVFFVRRRGLSCGTLRALSRRAWSMTIAKQAVVTARGAFDQLWPSYRGRSRRTACSINPRAQGSELPLFALRGRRL